MCLAVPGKVVSCTGDEPLDRAARVSFGGVVREVSLALLPEAQVGDYVLVHVGFAIAAVDEHEARRLLAQIAALGEGDEPLPDGPAGEAP